MKASVFCVAMLFLSGCAAIQENEEAQKQKWLTQADFHVMEADTPSQKAALAAMKPYVLESKVRENTVVYRYADPAAGLVYIGGAREYAAYKRISVSTKARRAANLSQITPFRPTGPLVW